MKTGKHTPGPWDVCGEQTGITEYSDMRHIYAQADKAAGGTGCVACVPSCSANARLVAAAPELLEACREALALLGDPDADSTDADRVERVLLGVIAKATGDQ